MNPPSPARAALSAWRKEARRLLVALAVAAEAPPDPPDDDLGLLDLSGALRPTDPGGWAGVLGALLDGPHGVAVRAHGLDPVALLMLEVLYLERVPAAPPFALYQATRGPSPAWTAVSAALAARDGLTPELRTRAIERLLRTDALLSPDERALLDDARARLGRRGSAGTVVFLRAAGEAPQVGAYPEGVVPVVGAQGWELVVTITRGPRDWMVEAVRRWHGDGTAPGAPAMALRLEDAAGTSLAEASLAPGATALVTYVDPLPRELHLHAFVLPEDR